MSARRVLLVAVGAGAMSSCWAPAGHARIELLEGVNLTYGPKYRGGSWPDRSRRLGLGRNGIVVAERVKGGWSVRTGPIAEHTRTRELARLRALAVPKSFPRTDFEMLSSGEVLAITQTATPPYRHEGSGPAVLDVIGPSGKPRRLLDCKAVSWEPFGFPAEVAVSGSAIAYRTRKRCRPSGGFIVDFGAGLRRALPPLRLSLLAGDLLFSSDDRVVYDWRAGHELYRVAAPFFYDSALQADGKLALAVSSEECGDRARSIIWYSPAEPRPHAVPGCSDEYPTLEMARDRILRLGVNGRDLEVHDLATGQTRTVASDLFSWWTSAPIFDGRHVAWSVVRCSAQTSGVYVEDVENPSPVPDPRRPCRGRIVGISSRLGPQRRIRVVLRCPEGCQGELALNEVAGQRSLLPIAQTRSIDVGPGRPTAVFLRAEPWVPTRLRVSRSLRGRATLRLRPGGMDRGDFHRDVHLRAPPRR